MKAVRTLSYAIVAFVLVGVACAGASPAASNPSSAQTSSSASSTASAETAQTLPPQTPPCKPLEPNPGHELYSCRDHCKTLDDTMPPGATGCLPAKTACLEQCERYQPRPNLS